MNLVKFEVEEKIRLSLIRNRGNLIKTSEDTGYAIELVKKIFDKMRKKQDRDVSYYLATMVMRHLLEGHDSRVAFLLQYLYELECSHQVDVSACCHSPIRLETFKRKGGGASVVTKCFKCGKECSAVKSRDNSVYSLRLQILNHLRDEDSSLADFADKMGYSAKENSPNVVNKNAFLVIDGGNSQRKVIDSEFVKDVEGLSPTQRTELLTKLEHHVLNGATAE